MIKRLVEELKQLQRVAEKCYTDVEGHRDVLENEIADVAGCLQLVMEGYGLDVERIAERAGRVANGAG